MQVNSVKEGGVLDFAPLRLALVGEGADAVEIEIEFDAVAVHRAEPMIETGDETGFAWFAIKLSRRHSTTVRVDSNSAEPR
jgi:hypothetical protein